MEQVANGCNVLQPHIPVMVSLPGAFGPTHVQSYKTCKEATRRHFVPLRWFYSALVIIELESDSRHNRVQPLRKPAING